MACRGYIKLQLRTDESWAEFDDAKCTIIKLPREKFDCCQKFPIPLVRWLRSKGEKPALWMNWSSQFREDMKAWVQVAEGAENAILVTELLGSSCGLGRRTPVGYVFRFETSTLPTGQNPPFLRQLMRSTSVCITRKPPLRRLRE
jgi:hypothetical protein